MCCLGPGFLLQPQGAWLSDEECAGSFGVHPAEPALDGKEPAIAAKMALMEALNRASAPLAVVKTSAMFALFGRSHSDHPGQSTNQTRRCALPVWTRCLTF